MDRALVRALQTRGSTLQLRRLLKLIASKSAEEMKNNIEFLGAWG